VVIGGDGSDKGNGNDKDQEEVDVPIRVDFDWSNRVKLISTAFSAAPNLQVPSTNRH